MSNYWKNRIFILTLIRVQKIIIKNNTKNSNSEVDAKNSH